MTRPKIFNRDPQKRDKNLSSSNKKIKNKMTNSLKMRSRSKSGKCKAKRAMLDIIFKDFTRIKIDLDNRRKRRRYSSADSVTWQKKYSQE